MRRILSIQSSVAYGHVGNSAVAFPLMRIGIEVVPVITVHFSNHTGYGAWRGPLLTAADVAEVIRGLDERGVPAECDAVLSGYQGAGDVGAVVLDAVALVRERHPGAVYCCDPVLGDVGRGFFVRPGIPEFMRDAVVPAADLITPNHFELDFLSGRASRTLPEVLDAADALRATGPDVVLVTSVRTDDVAGDQVGLLVVDGHGAWLVRTPLLPISPNGAGDLTAALFLAEWLKERDAATALERTAAQVFGVLAATATSGQRELQLVAAQNELVAPTYRFPADQVR